MVLSEIVDNKAKRKIDIGALINSFSDDLNNFIHLVESYNFKIRMVGGVCRSILLHMIPRDIDLITNALPDEIIYICEENQLDYTTHGLAHGTIRIKFSKNDDVEITSLGYQISSTCCPKELDIRQNRTWYSDAQRRDFTINSMSLDFNGHLFDYLHGYDDLRKQNVKFIKSPEKAITDDPIIMLRFFYMLSLFPNPQFDKSVLGIIHQHADLLKKIRPKKITQMENNIAKSRNGTRILNMMKKLTEHT